MLIMARPRFRSLLIFLSAIFLSGPLTTAAAEPVMAGAIEGTVTYQADPARPWRYARYYIKQAKTGELAEAVVALRAKPVVDATRPAETVTIDQQNFQFTP